MTWLHAAALQAAWWRCHSLGVAERITLGFIITPVTACLLAGLAVALRRRSLLVTVAALAACTALSAAAWHARVEPRGFLCFTRSREASFEALSGH